MLHIVLTYLVITQAQPAAAPDPNVDTLPPPGMYTIYKNGVGEPLYMFVPDQAQYDHGNRMKIYNADDVARVMKRNGLPYVPPYVIPDPPIVDNTTNAQPQKGPTFLNRLGRGMQAAGQSMGGGGFNPGVVPLQQVQPLQFTPMQRPMTVSPGVRLMNGPTYTFYP